MPAKKATTKKTETKERVKVEAPLDTEKLDFDPFGIDDYWEEEKDAL